MYFILLLFEIFALYYVNHKFSIASNRFIVASWFIVFVMLGTYGYFSDDYEPYIDSVALSYANPFANIHMEPFWIYLSDVCKGEITEFRFLSFSSIAIILWLVCWQAKMEAKYFLCYYTLLCMASHICWIRQPLAMAVFILGVILLINKKIICAIPCLIGAYFFHKTGFVFLLMLTFILIPLNKRAIWLYIIMGISFVFGFSLIINLNLPITSFLLLYLESEGEFAARNIVFTMLSNIALICNFILSLGLIYHFYNHKNVIVHYLLRYLSGLVLLALCLTVIPYETGVMEKRILAMANFINVIILSIALKSNLYQKKYYLISLPIFAKFLISEVMTFGNNYTKIYRLTKPF